MVLELEIFLSRKQMNVCFRMPPNQPTNTMKKALFIFLFIAVSLSSIAQSRSIYFVHISTLENTSEHITFIDHPLLNGNPNARILVTQNWNPPGGFNLINDHVTSVYFEFVPDQWAIYNEDLGTLNIGVAFNVLIVLDDAEENYTHTVTNENVAGNVTYLPETPASMNHNTLVFETHIWNPGGIGGVLNNYKTGVYYTDYAWSLYNENSENQVLGASHNVMMPGSNMSTYIHTATLENQMGFASYSYLDHPQLNGHPEAIVITTHNWNPPGGAATYLNEVIGVWYESETGHWVLYTQSNAEMPVGAAFNIAVGYPQPMNDDCVNAMSIDYLFHQQEGIIYTSSPVTNNGAVINDADPTISSDCWFSSDIVDNNVWFSFEGDGQEYTILTSNCGGSLIDNYIELGDTQMAIYAGGCGGLSLVACNDDSDQSSGSNLFSEITIETGDGVTYYVMIDGYSAGTGVPADGNFCIEVVQNIVGVTEVSGPQVAIFPNPTNGILNVSISKGVELIQIMDASGRVVEVLNQPMNSNLNIDCSSFESGIYFLRAISPEGSLVKTFVKE